MSGMLNAIQLGQLGCQIEASPFTAITPPAGRTHWTAIQIINDAKFHTLTNTIATGDALANTTLANAPTIGAGIVLYGAFTAFQLHQGIVIAYYGD